MSVSFKHIEIYIGIMKRIYERIFVVIFCLSLSAAAAQAQDTFRVAVLGDSLTSGYQLQPEQAFPARLLRKLQEVGYNNIEMINMSEAGATTADGAQRVDQLILKSPDVAVVELGNNDALRGIAIEHISNNLFSIISKLRQRGAYVVLMGAKAPPNMGYSYSAQLEEVYKGMTTFFEGLPLYPFALEGIIGNPELNLADGVHPNSKGVDVMVEGVYRLVDAGIRWKWEQRQYQQEYQQQIQEQLQQNSPMAPAPAPR